MKKTYFILIFLFIQSNSNAQSWIWAKNIDHYSRDIGKSIGTDQQNNVYVTGRSDCPCGSSGSGYSYSMFWKFDNLGNMLWADTLDIGGKSVTDSNGYTYIASGAIAKYNNGGLKIWQMIAPIGIVYQNIALFPLGGIVMVGNVLISGTTESVLSRYDENGICLWTKIGEFPLGGVIACDIEGNSYIAGEGYMDSISGNMGFLVKYDNSGNLIYNRTIPHTANDIAVDNENNIYVTGWFAIYPITINSITYYSNYPSNPQPQYLIKYDQTGNVLWYKIINGDIGRDAITTDTGGNVYLTIGYSDLNMDSINITSPGILVMKMDSIGNILWIKQGTYLGTSPGTAYSNDISVNSNGEVFIAGAINGTFSFDSYTINQPSMYTDLLIAKIGSGITTNTNNISPQPIKIKEFNIFPNPGQGIFEINYKTSSIDQIQINIFNTMGEKVYSEMISHPQKEFIKNINLSKESKGAYYIEIIDDGKKNIKKFVLN